MLFKTFLEWWSVYKLELDRITTPKPKTEFLLCNRNWSRYNVNDVNYNRKKRKATKNHRNFGFVSLFGGTTRPTANYKAVYKNVYNVITFPNNKITVFTLTVMNQLLLWKNDRKRCNHRINYYFPVLIQWSIDRMQKNVCGTPRTLAI